MAPGDRVLVRAKGTPHLITAGKVVGESRRSDSFRVRFIDYGVVRSATVPVDQLEKIKSFDMFFQKGVVDILEVHL